ncbi:hypothetical protein D8Y22_12315 [Salinadaptatus halalkaliphilus]|uniref:Heme NO-binding domain-containing protein n=1 Tax=Salinadaptatus halalkaliphilus TaxID=2419781 RepID=A0A4S3TNC4_9EURY|nr:heme NO-binding domain-containing protein [Salinadaptatus halalkaliphilus]THE64605.1 hypothetical protein D8Y22_12315 [Salinadaptatus halalkaliphilus]
MHGVVHKTLKEYVVDRSDEATWEAILERTDVEATLYLPVSTYDDRDIDVILETLSTMAVQNRRQIERGFGRRLAPELLSTFGAHVDTDWPLPTLLECLGTVIDNVDDATADTALPTITTRRDGDDILVTYRSDRDYCGLAHGVLEGLVGEDETTTTVSKRDCVHDGAEVCSFRVTIEDGGE